VTSAASTLARNEPPLLVKTAPGVKSAPVAGGPAGRCSPRACATLVYEGGAKAGSCTRVVHAALVAETRPRRRGGGWDGHVRGSTVVHAALAAEARM